MLKIIGKRGTGKTEVIIDLCKKYNGLLIVENVPEKEQAIRRGINSNQVIIACSGFEKQLYGKHYDIYIDVRFEKKFDIILEAVRDVGQVKAVTIQE